MKKLFSYFIVFFICLFMNGNVLAADNGAAVSLVSPAANQSFKPGSNVTIHGTADNINQLAILVRNPGGAIAYAAQPTITNGSFVTNFRLNDDAAEGQYSIRIGAKELAAPVDFAFKVSKSDANNGNSPNHQNNQSSTAGGSGGSVTPTVPVVKPNPEASTVTSVKSDTAAAPKDTTGHWAEANIYKLVALGAIKGYPDGCFKPDNTITRAEFATVLVKAYKLENKSGKLFTDTASHWAKDYVAAAASNGIVNGYDAEKFGPDDLITREQMAVMIVKAAQLAPSAGENKFGDSGRISGWASEAMATATRNQIMKGYPDNSVRPQGMASRAEAVTVIVNAMNR